MNKDIKETKDKLIELKNKTIDVFEESGKKLDEHIKDSKLSLESIRKIKKVFGFDLIEQSEKIVDSIFKSKDSYLNPEKHIIKGIDDILSDIEIEKYSELYEIMFGEKMEDVNGMRPIQAKNILKKYMDEIVLQISCLIAEAMKIKMEAIQESLKKIEGLE